MGHGHSKYICMLLMLTLLITSLHAVSYTATLTPQTESAFPQETARFNLTVTNTGTSEDSFVIYTQSTQPSWFSQKDTTLHVSSQETESTTIYATPRHKALAGNHGFFTYVYPQSNETESQKLKGIVTVRRNHSIMLQSFQTNKAAFKPGDTVTVKASILSVVQENVVNHSIQFQVGKQQKTLDVPLLQSARSITLDTSFQLSDTAVGSLPVSMTLYDNDGKRIASEETTISVASVENIDKKRHTAERILWKDHTITIKNKGNVEKDVVRVTDTLSILGGWLLSSDEPLADKTRDGSQTTVAWTVSNIAPGEEVTITYRINYYILYLVLALIAIIVYIALQEFRTVSAVKRAYKKKDAHTIHLHITNHTKRRANKVTITDFLPDTVTLQDVFETTAPDTQKTEHGVYLTWEIGSLAPGEERILSYVFKPKVHTEESVTLEPAQIEYTMRQTEQTTSSNEVHVTL